MRRQYTEVNSACQPLQIDVRFDEQKHDISSIQKKRV
jgi:hypothetical protein